ncbi:uncharacterized protein LOC144864139 isoform X2 [Branchiostoma floridae x Branchiostoma japonicum]
MSADNSLDQDAASQRVTSRWPLPRQILKSQESTISVGSGTSNSSEDANDPMKKWRNLTENLKEQEETGVTPLMIAVRENKLVVAERLLELGANLNDRAKDGRTVMHFAAASAKDEVVKLLIAKKADATIPGGPLDQLPIHVACSFGDSSFAGRNVGNNRAFKSRAQKEQLPLHTAASRPSGAINVVQMLLKVSGKEGRLVQDKDGNIPIFLATEAGNFAVCKELLSQYTEQQVIMQRKDNGDYLLHMACRRKDQELAKLFLDNGANVNAQNEEGHTALHIAAFEGDEAMIKYLQTAKADANIVDKLDRSPLHISAEKGQTNVVEVLVDKFKASVLARTKDGSTLMHIASQCGHPETALTFLKKGVPLHMPNKAGAVCLHAAAKRGHTAVVKALLQKGAVVDARTKDNYTALHIAVQFCKPMVVQTLLGFGAQVGIRGGKNLETPLHIAARVKEGDKVAEMLLKSGAEVNAPQEDGETALHIAARHGNIKMMQALMEDGGDLMMQSKMGENPLHIAVRYCHWELVSAIINYLVSEKTRVDAVICINTQTNEGETPVHYAAETTKDMCHFEGEDIRIMQMLLEFDGDVNMATKLTQETPMHYCARAGNEDVLQEMVKNIGAHKVQHAVNKQAKNGWSPLLVASEQGHLSIMKILLQNHARVDVFDEHGKAALHLAAENGHKEVSDVLLWHKAFVNAKSKMGITPLHLAAMNGFVELVKLLIETHGATLDALTLAKRTPLHMAAQNGQLSVCKTLLDMKADANFVDTHGQTPFHLAAENDHSEVVQMFLNYKPELVNMANAEGNTCAHIAAFKGSVAVIKELLKFDRVGVCSARNKINASTPLHLAAEGGHKEVVKTLADNGASATDENGEGMTPIHLAAKSDHTNVLDSLRGAADLKTPSTKTGMTALHVAAMYGQVDFVREMLQSVPATVKSEQPMTTDSSKEVEYGFTPLHLASQSGHEGLVRVLLNYPGVQADAQTAVQGSIPLHLAAANGHTSVVGLLLSKSTTQLHIKDKRGRTALHLAAANGHLDMVALLLGQGSDINVFDKNGWTSLHFAAKAGFLNVVKLLVESGASPKFETKDGKVPICYAASCQHHDVLSYLMKKDHNTTLLMDDKKFVFDLMVCGKMRDNQCIEEFVLVSPAPVDTAAKLSKSFELLSFKEKERAKDLMNAAKYCEEMATELLAIASSNNNAGALLRSMDCRSTPFLDVLIECAQKDVVAHPAVQKYLTDVWMGVMKTWASWKIMLLFLGFLICPPVWVAFSIPLGHRYNKVPAIKLMSYITSHFFQIGLFVIMIVAPIYPLSDNLFNLMPNWNEWLLLAWMSGNLVSELTNPGDRQGLGWIKIIIIAICAIAAFCHLLAFAFTGNTRLDCLSARNQLLGFSLLLSFVQFLEFLSFHHLFGPWAIIIRDLMKDMVRFLVILLIFMAGFTLHLAAVYQPVYPPPTVSSGDGSIDQTYTIQTPDKTFEILFFSLFGLIEPDNLPTLSTRHPSFIPLFVKMVFGTYMMVAIIVLINLLIAMMSDTYQRIQAQSDIEWKFGRAKLIRNMNKTSSAPSPLNLITKLFSYLRLVYKVKCRLCSPQMHEYMQEEDDQDGISDARSVDVLQHSGGAGFFRGLKKRSTQVGPEGPYLASATHSGPQRIEDVVDWEEVVNKYLAAKGVSDSAEKEADGPRQLDELNNTNEKASSGVDGKKDK